MAYIVHSLVCDDWIVFDFTGTYHGTNYNTRNQCRNWQTRFSSKTKSSLLLQCMLFLILSLCVGLPSGSPYSMFSTGSVCFTMCCLNPNKIVRRFLSNDILAYFSRIHSLEQNSGISYSFIVLKFLDCLKVISCIVSCPEICWYRLEML